MKNLLILSLFILASCATNKKIQCSPWSVNCYKKARELTEQKKYSESLPILEQGCELSHQHSCSDAGFVAAHLNNMDKAKKYSAKSCELGDELGCYNLACYMCREGNLEQTLFNLEQSFRLGGSNWNERIKDPDFSCLNEKHFKVMKKWQIEASDNVSMTINHTFIPTLFSSIVIPKDFDIKVKNPLILFHNLGATIIHSFEPPTSLDKNHKILWLNKKNYKKVFLKKFQKNGFNTLISKYEIKKAGKTLTKLISIIETPRGNVVTQATYPENMKITFEATLLYVIANVIYNPNWDYPSENKDALKKELSRYDLEFSGIHNGIYYFKRSVYKSKQFDINSDQPYLRFTKIEINNSQKVTAQFIKDQFIANGHKVKSIRILKNAVKELNYFELKMLNPVTNKTVTLLYGLKKLKEENLYFAGFYYFSKKQDAIKLDELIDDVSR